MRVYRLKARQVEVDQVMTKNESFVLHQCVETGQRLIQAVASVIERDGLFRIGTYRSKRIDASVFRAYFKVQRRAVEQRWASIAVVPAPEDVGYPVHAVCRSKYSQPINTQEATETPLTSQGAQRLIRGS